MWGLDDWCNLQPWSRRASTHWRKCLFPRSLPTTISVGGKMADWTMWAHPGGGRICMGEVWRWSPSEAGRRATTQCTSLCPTCGAVANARRRAEKAVGEGRLERWSIRLCVLRGQCKARAIQSETGPSSPSCGPGAPFSRSTSTNATSQWMWASRSENCWRFALPNLSSRTASWSWTEGVRTKTHEIWREASFGQLLRLGLGWGAL